MRYLLLIYVPETPAAVLSPQEMEARDEAYRRYTRDIVDRGLMEAGEALQPTNTATTVRVRNGQTLVTDGPYAETKEALGGFYLVDCRDIDEALELAAAIPGAQDGAIEVRPIWELPAMAEPEGSPTTAGAS